MERYYLSIPKLQQLHNWSLRMDKWFHPTLYQTCDYLSMLGLKWNRVSKMGPVSILYQLMIWLIHHTIQTFWHHKTHNNTWTNLPKYGCFHFRKHPWSYPLQGQTIISQYMLLMLCQDMVYVTVCHWFYQWVVSSNETGQSCDEVIMDMVETYWYSYLPTYLTIQVPKAGLKIYVTNINKSVSFIKSTAWYHIAALEIPQYHT